jgi:hypothetical protein
MGSSQSWAKIETLSAKKKKTRAKRGGGMAHVGKHLLIRHEALSSNPSTTTTTKKKISIS